MRALEYWADRLNRPASLRRQVGEYLIWNLGMILVYYALFIFGPFAWARIWLFLGCYYSAYWSARIQVQWIETQMRRSSMTNPATCSHAHTLHQAYNWRAPDDYEVHLICTDCGADLGDIDGYQPTEEIPYERPDPADPD